MASKNDFKILNAKCQNYFSVFENEKGIKYTELSEIQRARFGFYFLMIGNLCDIKDITDIEQFITDTDFNKNINKQKIEDYGVDAIFIDYENRIINIFNFKFRESFNPDKQQNLNESYITTKFIQAIQNESTEGLNGIIKKYADNIIDLYNSKDIWKMRFYIISNENKVLETDIPEFSNLRDLYDLETICIGLDSISQMISLRPSAIDAVLHIDKDALIPFSEDNLSTEKSFILRITANELIRITCNNAKYRTEYAIEDYSILADTSLDYGVLFDNVRGFVAKSKFNKNMAETLEKEPSKFFMYNNGLTVTAEDISSDVTNAGKKIKLTIKNLQIVNGGQTLRTLHDFKNKDKNNIENYLSNCQVLIRLFKTSQDLNTKNKIAEYTNSQNKISIIDLKSLASEQIQIEQFLKEKNILYTRKSGDFGGIDNRNYKKQISMERLGQILFSINGNPEKASTQKKAIFEKYYNQVFIEKFDMSKIVEYIDAYYEIKEEYEKNTIYDYSDQKAFYVLYLSTLNNVSFRTWKSRIDFLENRIKNFNTSDQRADSRKLIMTSFKDLLTSNYIDAII